MNTMFNYQRKISAAEARGGFIIISKTAYLKEFPKHHRFTLSFGNKKTTAQLMGAPCLCQGLAKPHVHYYLFMKKPFPLKAGQRIIIAHELGTKRYIMRKK